MVDMFFVDGVLWRRQKMSWASTSFACKDTTNFLFLQEGKKRTVRRSCHAAKESTESRRGADGVSPRCRRNIAEKPMEYRREADGISLMRQCNIAEVSTQMPVSTKMGGGADQHRNGILICHKFSYVGRWSINKYFSSSFDHLQQ